VFDVTPIDHFQYQSQFTDTDNIRYFVSEN